VLYFTINTCCVKQFDVPIIYRSPIISAIKQYRKELDKLKKDFTPTLLDFGVLKIYLARHFGFCYGVENAIDIAFKTIESNPDKRIFLLSEMIHNPHVNEDLLHRGVQFLMNTQGNTLFPFELLTKEDIVIIPAFGTTLQIEEKLHKIGLQTERYNTTCPFVEKVWNRSEAIAKKGYTVIIHGKPKHEETRATFSHASANAPTVIIHDMQEAQLLAQFIRKEKPIADFYTLFKGKHSTAFDVEKDLQYIGVVNQTTQLASETQSIAEFLKKTIISYYGLTNENVGERFADTRDTLCYATNDNQASVKAMLEVPADLAIVIGGYNSSNSTHLVELCEKKLKTYFISSEEKMISKNEILYFNIHTIKEELATTFLPIKKPLTILITSGASCPDVLVENVIKKILQYFDQNLQLEDALTEIIKS